MEKYDAVIILSGGVRPGGGVPKWVERRLDRGIELINDTKYLICTSAYTPHKAPLLDDKGFPILDSFAMGNYLIKKGVDKNKILLETTSFDTLGNAYFTRILHTDQINLRKLLIITSEFHMPRSKALFKWIFNLNPPQNPYQLSFETVSDDIIDPEILAPRIIKEQHSLDIVLELISKIKSMEDLHNWLFSQHSAYSLSPNKYKTPVAALPSY